MAYVELDDALIQVGEPTKKEIFQTIKDNQESFNTDIEALKQTATIDIFDLKYTGDLPQYSATELDNAKPTFRAPVSATFTSFVVTLLEASTSGNLEVSIEKSVDNGANWSALLTTPVTVSGTTAGSISGAVNWIDVPSQSFAQNDMLRIIIDGVQVNQGDFHISVYGELS